MMLHFRSGRGRRATSATADFLVLLSIALLAAIIPLRSGIALAEDGITVAVAADFYRPFKEIARLYADKGGQRLRLVSGSTGKLYAQIAQGAPFQMFFAADAKRPALLEAAGLAKAGSRFTYARGRLALWTPRDDLGLKKRGLGVLLDTRVRRIAVANPKTAPYGVAAMQVLASAGIAQVVRSKLVYGESVAQAAQFALSGNADAALLPPASVIGAEGERVVLEAGYAPIIQQAVMLQGAPAGAAALRAFFATAEVHGILAKYGFGEGS